VVDACRRRERAPTKEAHMSEDEKVTEQDDDVEGHRRLVSASDEPKAEGEESDDDVEAHMRRSAPKKF
jgi:hypothetical protein